MAKIDPDEIYTTKEMAEIMGVSNDTIRRMCNDGRIKSFRLGHRVIRIVGKAMLEYMHGKAANGGGR